MIGYRLINLKNTTLQVIKQFLIAIDQTANTLIYLKKDAVNSETGFGYSDETLSARLWRLQHPFYKVVDRLFFFDKEGDKMHCQLSFESELNRKQLPSRYSEYFQ